MRRRGASRGRPVWFRGSFRSQAVTGTEGDLPGVRSTRRRRNPPTNDNLEVQNEDGEKSSPRFRGRYGRDRRGAGRRSSRQGQAGPVREDLHALWRRVLLHPRFRHLYPVLGLYPGRLRLQRHRRPHRRTTRVRPVRRTARSATTRPGIVAASRSTRGRRLPTARCGRSRPIHMQNENTVEFDQHLPRLHPVGRLHLRPDGVVHRPRRQHRRLRHALAAPDAEPERHRRQRHQPDRLHLAAGQRRHPERRRRRASREVDREPVEQCAAPSRDRRRSDVVPCRQQPSQSLGFVARQPGLGPCQRRGGRQPQRGDLLHDRHAAVRLPAAIPARRCAAIRTTSGAGRSSRAPRSSSTC